MATLSIVSSTAVQGVSGYLLAADTKSNTKASAAFRSRGAQRGFYMKVPARGLTFRRIKKSASPRLNRPFSRRFVVFTTAAVGGLQITTVTAKEQEDDVVKKLRTDDGNDDAAAANSSSDVLNTVNAVLADIVDGQKYIKETGRTKARPMKRRALVVCLALGAFRGSINDVESTLGNLRRSSPSGLARSSSASFARTVHLISQLSFGASGTGSPVSNTSNSSEI